MIEPFPMRRGFRRKKTDNADSLSVNKKIKGAVTHIYNGIKFRSGLEVSSYKKLELSGLTFSYESERILLWKGLKLKEVQVIAPNKISAGKYTRELFQQTRALLNITYTPDFIVRYKDYKIYFDVKGMPNDTYPIKKKMLLRVLEERSLDPDDHYKYMFFEPHNVGQMEESIKLIKLLQ